MTTPDSQSAQTANTVCPIKSQLIQISQFDRATRAKRQPGSSIKPFVYLTALDHGFTPSTLVLDGPISLPQGPGLPMWSPANYTNRHHGPQYRGPTPLRVGLEQSLMR
jgi:penicillin-binding protein 1A